jgi:KaiC/GvpD/RAD55 family RecA-like ATPase
MQPWRLRVRGTAGSGKTQLALQALQKAHAAGKSALYVCFNRPLADAMKLQREIGRHDAGQRVVDGLHILAAHLTNEPQRQMELFTALPARAGNPALKRHQRLRHGTRKGKRNKQSHCDNRPSGRRLRSSSTVRP